MSIAYDLREDPPAPFVQVQVTNLDTQESQSAHAKLDTGAAITILPESLAMALNLKPRSEVLVGGYDGVGTWRNLYLVSLNIAEFSLPYEVVASPRDNILLGRDVLNHFILTLDGKAQTFEMIDP